MVGFVSFMDKPKFINKCLQKKVAFFYTILKAF